MADMSAWSYYKEITIDNANVDATLSNFPIVVQTSSDSDLSSNAKASGGDVRFTADDGTTLLDSEKQNYASGTGNWWVRIPSIASASTTTIRMYYGNSSSSDDSNYELGGTNAEAVWDSNYQGVYHLQSIASGATDSTSHGRDLTNTGSMPNATGIVGNCAKITGSSLAQHLTGTFTAWATATTYTIESFTRNGTSSSLYSGSRMKDSSYYYSVGVKYSTSDTAAVVYKISSIPSLLTQSKTPDQTNFLATVARHSSSSVVLDHDGTTSSKSRTGTMAPNEYNIKALSGANGTNTYVDEVRFSNTYRSNEWIKFYQYNIESSDNELTIGSEQSNGSSFTPTITMILS